MNQIERGKKRLLKYRNINKNTGCWEWSGTCYPNGYGKINVRYSKGIQTTIGVHRYAIEIFQNISLDKDDIVHHMCHNPKCFNPDHLQITIQKINMLKKNSDWDLFYMENKELVDLYDSVSTKIRNTYKEWKIQMQLKLF